jgi:hypothetical protein
MLRLQTLERGIRSGVPVNLLRIPAGVNFVSVGHLLGLDYSAVLGA